MTTDEASKILEIAPNATPEQLEDRFNELRMRLEDKLAKAPTPGLKDKYRRSLDAVTKAFETLVLAGDSSDLPVLQRTEPGRRGPVAGAADQRPSFPAAPGSPVEPERPRAGAGAPPKKKSANREFLVVAGIALLMLVVGGWWVVNTRAKNAERAHLEAAADAEAAAARADAERVAEEEKARHEALNATLRAQLAEARIKWEIFDREAQDAERRLTELKSDVRSARDLPAAQRAELDAQLFAQQSYVDWLHPHLLRHPAKALLAKLDALLSARAVEEAAEAGAELAEELVAAEIELAARKRELLAISAPLHITSEPPGLAYELRDSYGRLSAGKTPFEMHAPLGAATVKISRPGWPDQVRELVIRRGESAEVKTEFASGTVRIASDPVGLAYELTSDSGFSARGQTPADRADVPVGPASIKIVRPGWPEFAQEVVVRRDEPAETAAAFPPGRLQVTSTPSGAEVWVGEKRLGETPLSETLPPGNYSVRVALRGHVAAAKTVTIAAGHAAEFSVALERGGPRKGQAWTVPDLGVDLVPIAAGTFRMGGAEPKKESKIASALAGGILGQVVKPRGNDQADENSFVAVTLTEPFWLGKTEVTQAQWEALMGSNPSLFKGADLPVEQVSWRDANEFCLKLTERELAAGRLPDGYVYSLPTEAQWEYACRAGTTGDFAGNLDAMGWYGGNSGMQTHPVGRKQANAWGLHDMHGNVSEWCADWHGEYAGGSMIDPRGPGVGELRVVRGGSWVDTPSSCRSGYRHRLTPDIRVHFLGFRVALRSARGDPPQPFLGILMQDLTEGLAGVLNVGTTAGALIGDVMEGSPAEAAQLQQGDVAVRFNGKEVANSAELRLLVLQAAVGRTVPVEIIRNSERLAVEVTLDATLAQAPGIEGGEATATPMLSSLSGVRELLPGLRVAPLDPALRKDLAIPEGIRAGLVIVELDENSSLVETLPVGAIVVEINRRRVEDVDAARNEIRAGQNLFLINFRGRFSYVALAAPADRLP